jgi:hypothetical protein
MRKLFMMAVLALSFFAATAEVHTAWKYAWE